MLGIVTHVIDSTVLVSSELKISVRTISVTNIIVCNISTSISNHRGYNDLPIYCYPSLDCCKVNDRLSTVHNIAGESHNTLKCRSCYGNRHKT